MKVSIITVCKNSEKYIEETIFSILGQTYEDIEYIIIDGESTDSTISIVKKIEPLFNGKLRWISEKDKGIYDAMNKGIDMATGEIIGILNSDDFFINNNVIERIVDLFLLTKADSVYADLYYVRENDVDKICRKWHNGEQKKFAAGWHPAHPAFFVKKSIYDKYGKFNLNYRISSDFEIMLRFLEKYKISAVYLEEYIIKMRMGGESNRTLKNIVGGNKEILKAFKMNEIKHPFYYTYRRLFKKLAGYIKYY